MPIKTKWMPFKIPIIEALSIRESGVYEIGKARGNKVLYIGKSDKSYSLNELHNLLVEQIKGFPQEQLSLPVKMSMRPKFKG